MAKLSRRTLFVTTFIGFGLLAELLFWASNLNALFAFVLSPVLYGANWLDAKLAFLAVPSFLNELFTVVPVNILYFGSLGLWVGRISQEHGGLKVLALLTIFAFLFVIHWQAALSLRELIPSLIQLNLPQDPFRLGF